MTPTLVLLAAGMSTRFGRLKQLEPVGPAGEVLIDYAAFDAQRAGFSRVVLIIREELKEAFLRHIDDRWPADLEVIFHEQRIDDLPGVAAAELGTLATLGSISGRKKPWGTAHALLTARELLPQPFLVLNADDFYGRNAFVVAREIMREMTLRGGYALPSFGIVTYTLEDTLSQHGAVNRGICRVRPSGELAEIQEVVGISKTARGIRGRTLSGDGIILSGKEPTSTNCWVFSPHIFPILAEGFAEFLGVGAVAGGLEVSSEPEFLIPTAVNHALVRDRIQVKVRGSESLFLGITHPEDRDWVVNALAALTLGESYPSPLWAGGEPMPTDANE
jgi:UTP-glucose-1-phosphate uridylyltransferase